MDFSSIMAAEISKKRKPEPSSKSSAEPAPKKYTKRSELEAQRRREYEEKQKRLEKERRERAEKKRQEEEEERNRREATKAKQKQLAEEKRRRKDEEEAKRLEKGGPLAKEGSDGFDETNGSESMTEAEAIERLRSMGEPARLFAETHAQKVRRLKRLLAALEIKNREATPPLSEEEMVLSPDDIPNDKVKVYRQLAAWFALVLSEWEIMLESRPAALKDSFQGKAAANSMTQAKTYMVPLFRHFKQKDLHEDIYTKVCEIVVEAQARRYVRANDVYLRLSIGNAAWPIGVTMVGIHERSAREKLHEKGLAAHIMSDEVTRKFLQSIKRCLSFCQTRWPPEDPLQLMG
ncbi:unnamed protein product [Tuber aestivum]|uniref:Pre-mRNA-splicing factor 18 n=1 Tax=Tuber aestivum TaxID=59557 RepID=A0A292PRP5_9PEZI|nr:unnamed protein product [Tuber aestivum]